MINFPLLVHDVTAITDTTVQVSWTAHGFSTPVLCTATATPTASSNASHPQVCTANTELANCTITGLTPATVYKLTGTCGDTNSTAEITIKTRGECPDVSFFQPSLVNSPNINFTSPSYGNMSTLHWQTSGIFVVPSNVLHSIYSDNVLSVILLSHARICSTRHNNHDIQSHTFALPELEHR